MSRHRISLPPADWPDDVRTRFEAADLSDAQRRRLSGALGWWLLHAPAPQSVTRDTWLDATGHLAKAKRNAIRQALALVHPAAASGLYCGDEPPAPLRQTIARSGREELAAHLSRHLPRLPEDWRARAARLVEIDAEALSDGVLIQAWAPSTVRRRVEAAGRYFDFCRSHGLPLDLRAGAVRLYLRQLQSSGARPASAQIALDSLLSFAQALWPDRNWAWLAVTTDRVRKIAGHAPSRNAGRAVPVEDLRAFGIALFDEAETAFEEARNRRDFITAHTRARTGLTIILLTESPSRIGALATLDLDETLLPSLVAARLAAKDTKTREAETRLFSRTFICCLRAYIARHRAVLAQPSEKRLFVGDDGYRVTGATLSACIGTFTEERLGRRATAHAFRHSVANFIVAAAPDEAALAGTILTHRSQATTPTYTTRADQVKASRRLAAAATSRAKDLGLDTGKTERRRFVRARKGRKRKMSSTRPDLAS